MIIIVANITRVAMKMIINISKTIIMETGEKPWAGPTPHSIPPTTPHHTMPCHTMPYNSTICLTLNSTIWVSCPSHLSCTHCHSHLIRVRDSIEIPQHSVSVSLCSCWRLISTTCALQSKHFPIKMAQKSKSNVRGRASITCERILNTIRVMIR